MVNSCKLTLYYVNSRKKRKKLNVLYRKIMSKNGIFVNLRYFTDAYLK